jgi:GMP synthase-like glutamine amidotransferase
VDLGVGVLGVCFGGQLVAAALGGGVERSDSPEIGWCDVHSSNSTLVPAGPWFQWHFDRWSLPPNATEIARNDCASQAFIQGSAMAVQFHPELDQQVLDVWIAEDRDGDAERLGLSAEALRARTVVEIADARRRLGLLVRGFLETVANKATANR